MCCPRLERWVSAGITAYLTFLELFPIMVTVHLWAQEFANFTIRFWCDNQAMVAVVNRLSSKSARIMGLVRPFVLQCLRINALFAARHVPGVENCIADALSRFREERFRELAPNACLFPDPMPQWL